MKKKPIGCLIFFLFFTGTILLTGVKAQVLFTYGNDTVTTGVFMHAFNKTHIAEDKLRPGLIKQYLPLYINLKLKSKAAAVAGMDTLPATVKEMNYLKQQLTEKYLIDSAELKRLTNEAFARSLKEIHAAHIFIAIYKPDGNLDTAASKTKAQQACNKLSSGASFYNVTREFSTEPGVAEHSGNLNYISVFTLPYEFENIVYNLSPGKFSQPYLSATGYHIFINIEERKAIGKVRLKQILLAYPINVTLQQKDSIQQLAGSIYKWAVTEGKNYDSLALIYSLDKYSNFPPHNIPPVTIGEWDKYMELQVQALKPGEICKPFETAYGYNLFKKIEEIPINSNPDDKRALYTAEQAVKQDQRFRLTRNKAIATVKNKVPVTTMPYSFAALQAYTDSSLYRAYERGRNKEITNTTTLFSIGNKNYPAEQWINYARYNGNAAEPSERKSINVTWNAFVNECIYEYYKANLATIDNEYNYTITEFKDGLLAFDWMQQNIWANANDYNKQVAFYNKNKNQFKWKPGARVLYFTAQKPEQLADIQKSIQEKGAANWRQLLEATNGTVLADSMRIENSEITTAAFDKAVKAGNTSPVLFNTDEHLHYFYYVIAPENSGPLKSFDEAKAQVITLYQKQLEEQLLQQLKKQYPVNIQQKELSALTGK